MGLEPCKTFRSFAIGILTQTDALEFLGHLSSLGGTPVEGVVIKNYNERTPEDHVLMSKIVGDNFAEKAATRPHKLPNGGGFFATNLGAAFATEARFNKAVQHLRDNGELSGSMKDVGPLMKELSRDLLEEYGDEFKEQLLEHYRKTIVKAASKGFPEWYAAQLQENAI
jgi:hypothetical protein